MSKIFSWHITFNVCKILEFKFSIQFFDAMWCMWWFVFKQMQHTISSTLKFSKRFDFSDVIEPKLINFLLGEKNVTRSFSSSANFLGVEDKYVLQMFFTLFI